MGAGVVRSGAADIVRAGLGARFKEVSASPMGIRTGLG